MSELTNSSSPGEDKIGLKIREIRTSQGLSLRVVAEKSGLNINTLSLIENGKTSPSVSTLQQLAVALDVQVIQFFEEEIVERKVIYTTADEGRLLPFGSTRLRNLAPDLRGGAIQAFEVRLPPGTGSGDRMIVHTGHECVYCLEGLIHYRIQGEDYLLKPGDSLVFEAHLPHCWENKSDQTSRILLILAPSDRLEDAKSSHFQIDILRREITMKVAVITDDGQSISRHFGRAPYYMIYTIEEGKVTNKELVNKLGHNHFQSAESAGGHEHDHSQGHGMDSASHDRHSDMAAPLAGCKALICGGMGMGAYQSMKTLNIVPVVTDLTDLDQAVQAFIDGKLVDHTEMLH